MRARPQIPTMALYLLITACSPGLLTLLATRLPAAPSNYTLRWLIPSR
jgi:hypothetical protein